MSKPEKTFSAFVMFCGANEVPEQSGLTRAECVAVLQETCENYEVDLILHIHTDSFPTSFEAEDVTEELFEEVYNSNVDGSEPDEIYQGYKGKLGEMVAEYIDNHETTRRGRAADRRIDEMRGK